MKARNFLAFEDFILEKKGYESMTPFPFGMVATITPRPSSHEKYATNGLVSVGYLNSCSNVIFATDL